MAKMEWIGTGSALNPALGNTSFIISAENSERTLLVDCGPTVPLNLISNNKIDQITDVVITHLHGDHFHGLEGLGLYNYFVLKRRKDNKLNLYLASQYLADQLRIALEVSISLIIEEGVEQKLKLDDYFNIIVTKGINIPNLPKVELFLSRHAGSLECYGLRFAGGTIYSGDTVQLPSEDATKIFQDCQFDRGQDDVHISYDKLNQELPPEVKAKTHLVHLGEGYEKRNPQEDGFAGFVMPGDVFEI